MKVVMAGIIAQFGQEPALAFTAVILGGGLQILLGVSVASGGTSRSWRCWFLFRLTPIPSLYTGPCQSAIMSIVRPPLPYLLFSRGRAL